MSYMTTWSAMKLSATNIPLRVFAASAAGLVGVAFCVGPLSVLPFTIHVHGLVSFVPIMDIFIACIGLSAIAFSVGVALRRRWAHCALVRLMLALIIVLVLALGRKELQDGRTGSERLMDLTVGPCLVIVMGGVLLFLVNRRVQDEFASQPNQSSQSTTPSVTPPAGQEAR
jgi:hypothetical protein